MVITFNKIITFIHLLKLHKNELSSKQKVQRYRGIKDVKFARVRSWGNCLLSAQPQRRAPHTEAQGAAGHSGVPARHQGLPSLPGAQPSPSLISSGHSTWMCCRLLQAQCPEQRRSLVWCPCPRPALPSGAAQGWLLLTPPHPDTTPFPEPTPTAAVMPPQDPTAPSHRGQTTTSSHPRTPQHTLDSSAFPLSAMTPPCKAPPGAFSTWGPCALQGPPHTGQSRQHHHRQEALRVTASAAINLQTTNCWMICKSISHFL